MGYDDTDYKGKPVVGLLNTWSDLNTCHSHLRERAAEIKRGVCDACFSDEYPVPIDADGGAPQLSLFRSIEDEE